APPASFTPMTPRTLVVSGRRSSTTVMASLSLGDVRSSARQTATRCIAWSARTLPSTPTCEDGSPRDELRVVLPVSDLRLEPRQRPFPAGSDARAAGPRPQRGLLRTG